MACAGLDAAAVGAAYKRAAVSAGANGVFHFVVGRKDSWRPHKFRNPKKPAQPSSRILESGTSTDSLTRAHTPAGWWLRRGCEAPPC